MSAQPHDDDTPMDRRINRRTSSVYVLATRVNGRATEEPSINADAKLILDFWDLLPPQMKAAFNAARVEEERRKKETRTWASQFLRTCMSQPRGPWPDQRGRWLSERDEMPLKMIVLGNVWRSGDEGRTAPEIQRQFDIISGGVPGALATLHAAGVLARLKGGEAVTEFAHCSSCGDVIPADKSMCRQCQAARYGRRKSRQFQPVSDETAQIIRDTFARVRNYYDIKMPCLTEGCDHRTRQTAGYCWTCKRTCPHSETIAAWFLTSNQRKFAICVCTRCGEKVPVGSTTPFDVEVTTGKKVKRPRPDNKWDAALYDAEIQNLQTEPMQYLRPHPQSPAECLLFDEWEAGRLHPGLRFNVPVNWLTRGTEGYIVDLIHQSGVVIEIDGFAFHSDEKARARDVRRDEVLTALGFYVYRLESSEVLNDPILAVKTINEWVEDHEWEGTWCAPDNYVPDQVADFLREHMPPLPTMDEVF